MRHNINLSALSRAELQELTHDIAQELETREHEERIALQERLRAVVQEAGFDPHDLRFGRRKRKPRTASQTNGENND